MNDLEEAKRAAYDKIYRQEMERYTRGMAMLPFLVVLVVLVGAFLLAVALMVSRG